MALSKDSPAAHMAGGPGQVFLTDETRETIRGEVSP
jgi:hypothetical protein